MTTCTWGGWERQIFTSDGFRQLFEKVLVWRWFIDNIFIVWTGNRDKLFSFLTHLKGNQYNLKFTTTCDQSAKNFLDISIFFNSDGTIDSSLYRKPLASNTILHATSSHPKSLIQSIPYSQYLRLKRNCSRRLAVRILNWKQRLSKLVWLTEDIVDLL